MLTLVWAMALAASAPAADVKAGVDAWQRGDDTRAVAIWKPLAAKGDPDAEFNLGQAYKLGRGVPQNDAAAQDLYRRAASQGHPQAQDIYGFALFRSGRHADALPWLQKAAAQDQPRAELLLGTMTYNGEAGAKDDARAYALVTRAVQQGLPGSTETQGKMDAALPDEVRRRGLLIAKQMAGGTGPAPVGVARIEMPVSAAAKTKMAAKAPPRAKPVTAARPMPAATAPVARAANAGRGWRLQLGAFRDESNARSLWQKLQSKVAALRPLAPAFVKAGGVTRLQAGPLGSSAEAQRACAAVKAAGTACVPVAP